MEDVIDIELIDNGFVDVRLETEEDVVGKMIIQKGCDFSQKLRIKDKDGNPVKLTLVNFIRFRVKNQTTNVDLCFPKIAAVDEIQKISFSSVPTVGTFKLSHEGNETSTIAFGDSAATVQAALRALKSLNDVTVAGIFDVTGLTITYITNDGGRDQPLLLIVDNTLKTGVTNVVITVTETTKGIGEHGIEISNGPTGLIEILGSEAEAALYADGLGADATLKIRIAAEDLPIRKLDKFLDVIAEI